MKSLIWKILWILISLASQYKSQGVQIVNYENTNDGLGNYRFHYELSDGTSREEEGHLKDIGTDQVVLVVIGSYSWIAPDGQRYSVSFIADENGYRPGIADIVSKTSLPIEISALSKEEKEERLKNSLLGNSR